MFRGPSFMRRLSPNGDLLSGVHHVLAVAFLTIYGYRVCNFISGLDVLVWTSTVVPIVLAQWAARTAFSHKVVALSPPEQKPRLAFAAEVAVFVAGGAAVGALNTLVHGFPAGSGVKVLIGFMAVGLFAGADQAASRIMARYDEGGLTRRVSTVRWSLFARVGTTAAFILAFMTVIACLLIMRVVEDSASYDRATFLRLSTEFGFVLIVFLVYVANLIRGLARVVDRGLREQVETLEQSRTVLGARRAIVGTGDEIGLVATELNGLLDTLEQTTRTAARANEAMIRGLVGLAGARDNETGLHLKRTQLYLTELCRELARHRTFADALTEEAIARLVAAAPLHDIGKVAIPDAILRKPGKLTEAEFAIMKTHVTEGLRVIDDVIAEVGATPFLSTVRDVVAGHHERYDGRGYPFGLAADAIPLAGRLMAVADVYDALRSARVYKPAVSQDEARRIIEEGAGSHFDPRIVAAFLAVEPEIHRISQRFSDDGATLNSDLAA